MNPEDVLKIKLDSIEDVRSKKHTSSKIDQKNHYEVVAHGTTLLVTEDRTEATRVYRESEDTDKRLIHVWQGKRLQLLPRGFF